MKKELKNRGLNGLTLAVWVTIAVVIIGFMFVPGNAVYDAPLGNKLGGIVLGIATLGFMFKSGDFLIDKIDSHIVLQVVQIAGSILLGLAALLTYTNAW